MAERKVVPVEQSKIVKCSECGLAQLKTKFPSRFFTTAEFSLDADENITLMLFEEKLESLYELYKTQNDVPATFYDLSDGEIVEMILTVNATIVYNDKLNVAAVTA
ncbi:hypothetical protein AWC38_SpisGene2789 [Stylophora pistillata]|uniref:Uncharacterized protein n=1 Tax=Stylophora pistillata TaxID=50429 RepID=A0A2B4SR56_STYPI|nr:hypothetical protein AWC38_SpisGene2789 [Stylophora pistillata]